MVASQIARGSVPFECFSVLFDTYLCSTPRAESGSYLSVEASPKTAGQRARLQSPELGPERGPFCLLFSYQLQGEGVGSLRVLLRAADGDEAQLWVLQGDQGHAWKQGRVTLPRSPRQYQVQSAGGSAVDQGGRLDGCSVQDDPPLLT